MTFTDPSQLPAPGTGTPGSLPADADASGKPFALLPAIAAMAACVASGIWACVAFLDAAGWEAQKPYAIYAGLVCGGAAIVAFVPVWLLSRKSVQGAAMGFMIGILVRMALCGVAVMYGSRIEGVVQRDWSMWIAGWYMLVLMIEVGMVGRYIKRASPPVKKTDGTETPRDIKMEYRAAT